MKIICQNVINNDIIARNIPKASILARLKNLIASVVNNKPKIIIIVNIIAFRWTKSRI